jgi:hypothetical protein
MQKNIIHAGLSARQMIHSLHVVEPEYLGDSNPDGPEKHVKIVLNPTRPKLYDLFIDKSQSGPKRPGKAKAFQSLSDQVGRNYYVCDDYSCMYNQIY